MQLVLEQRAERSNTIALVSPLIAIGADARDHGASCSPSSARTRSTALDVYFIEPLTDGYSLQEIAVKATPLVLIARRPVALLPRQCLEHRRRGPIPDRRGRRQLARGRRRKAPTPAPGCCRRCCCSARSAGALYALIPAICKVRFGASEILTSLMLVYVADLFLDYLVRGPWRDPQGLQLPDHRRFRSGRHACRC